MSVLCCALLLGEVCKSGEEKNKLEKATFVDGFASRGSFLKVKEKIREKKAGFLL